ncbi:MAG: SpoIIE family protein phosphatase, partial [Terriglobia bacterium]
EAGELALIVTEAASNQIKHAGGGDIVLRDLSKEGAPFIEVISIDSGTGMENVARCFADGYSTAGSQGTGLGAISRLSSFHDLYSQVGKGTILVAHVGRQTAETHFEMGALTLPYPGEDVCGDTWDYHMSGDRLRIIVADGLGHGLMAAQASVAAVSVIHDDGFKDPVSVVAEAHLRLKATRGAAIGVVDIDRAAHTVMFSGVGNVAGSVVTEEGGRRQMISMNGTLGHELRGVRQFEYPWPSGALIILHSDGLGTHWSFGKYPGLMRHHCSVIAGVLFRDFRRLRDDATVVVVLERP